MSGFNGGFLRPTKNRGSFIPMYWGDGSDGVLTAGDVYHAGTDYVTYSDFCIKQFSQINWNPATPEMLTVDEPCRGLILFSQRDVYIGQNAIISMAKIGSVLPVNPESLIEMYGDSAQMGHIVETLKMLKGGAGGDGGTGTNRSGGTGGTGGTGGAGRDCQGGIGGGGGGGTYEATGGDGGSIIHPDIFGHGGNDEGIDGYQGGGGAFNTTASNWTGGGHPYGGGAAGGGASRPGGDGEHSGGFILLIAKGSVTIEGTLDVTGGDGGSNEFSYPGGGGGGAGGGVIAIFSRTSVNTSSATIIKAGGAGGIGDQNGTGGQQGTFYSEAYRPGKR